MAQRPRWWHLLQGGKNEARLAVDLYNRPTEARSLEGFVVHMHLAWLYMLHAHFMKTGKDFRYWDAAHRRIIRVDGEPKTWELKRCVEEVFSRDDPVRRNALFFIALRNRIEHRYEQLLAAVVAGKVQAHLLNFETTLVQMFGKKEGIGDALRFPVFVSSLTPDAVDVLKKTYSRLPKRMTSFIREYDAAQPEEVQSDYRYDFRVLLVPQTGPKSEADAVMRFVPESRLTQQQRDVVQTIVRNRPVSVQNRGRHKPGVVAQKVEEALGVRFKTSDHTQAWRHFEVRPGWDAERPELTDDRYCVWDEPHGDYLYTDAWVKKLTRELADRKMFRRVTGHTPVATRAKLRAVA